MGRLFRRAFMTASAIAMKPLRKLDGPRYPPANGNRYKKIGRLSPEKIQERKSSRLECKKIK